MTSLRTAVRCPHMLLVSKQFCLERTQTCFTLPSLLEWTPRDPTYCQQVRSASSRAFGVNGTTGRVWQRYNSAVKNGLLRTNPHQEKCVARLDELFTDVTAYSAAMTSYQQQLTAYNALREQRRAELTAVEDARLRKQEEENYQRDRAGGSAGWLRRFGNRSGEHGSIVPTTPQQRQAIVKARVEAMLDAQLGPPVQRPTSPKGVYIYGSVGSGKTMLMDMFFSAIAETNCIPHARRMHFNAAALELHSRLHKLEKGRMRRDQADMQAFAQSFQQSEQADSRNEELGNAELSSRDPIMEAFKRSKLAKMAIRRLQRYLTDRSQEQQLQRLAVSNSVFLKQAARALILNSETSAADNTTADSDGESFAAVLAFDEMQTTDVWDCLALKGVMETLLQAGCVVVTTSNRAPWQLNRHGLHESLFSHFVDSLLGSCDILELKSEQDYRRLLSGSAAMQRSIEAGSQRYFHPLTPETEQAMERKWRELQATSQPSNTPAEGHAPAQHPPGQALKLDVMFGRKLTVQRVSSDGQAAWFEFRDLCALPLGAADYIAIATRFRTVFLVGVPAMSFSTRDQARRFITLVDELYNARTCLVMSAAVPPDELFAGNTGDAPVVDLEQLQSEMAVAEGRLRRNVLADGSVSQVGSTPAEVAALVQQLGGAEEKFAFARAVSRVVEMQSLVWRP